MPGDMAIGWRITAMTEAPDAAKVAQSGRPMKPAAPITAKRRPPRLRSVLAPMTAMVLPHERGRRDIVLNAKRKLDEAHCSAEGGASPGYETTRSLNGGNDGCRTICLTRSLG